MVVLLEGFHISTEELWSSVSDHRVLGHLPDQSLSTPIAQFGRTASSRKSIGGSELLPFKNDGGHCVLGDLQIKSNQSLFVTCAEYNRCRMGVRGYETVKCLLTGSNQKYKIR